MKKKKDSEKTNYNYGKLNITLLRSIINTE